MPWRMRARLSFLTHREFVEHNVSVKTECVEMAVHILFGEIGIESPVQRNESIEFQCGKSDFLRHKKYLVKCGGSTQSCVYSV